MLKSPILIKTDSTTPPENDLYIIDASDKSLKITLPDITCDGMYIRLSRVDNNILTTVEIITFENTENIIYSSLNSSTNKINLDVGTRLGLVSLNNNWYSV
jgi:hypothetical protein